MKGLVTQKTTYWKVVANSSTAGSTTINVPRQTRCRMKLVGAGGSGGHWLVYLSSSYYWYPSAGGGSGGYIAGEKTIAAGNYTLTIGAAGTYYGSKPGNNQQLPHGGDTSFAGEIAGGGKGVITDGGGYVEAPTAGTGGTNTTTLTTNITGKTGPASGNSTGVGCAASVWIGAGEYGRGVSGGVEPTAGVNGYAYVEIESTSSDYTYSETTWDCKLPKINNQYYGVNI